MQIDNIEVEAIHISEIMKDYSLDPITVVLKNFEPGKGFLTIMCYGSSWTCYFGAMSGQSIQEFFRKANTDYLIDKLTDSKLESEVPDTNKIQRDASDACEYAHDYSHYDYGLMDKLYNGDIPMKPNPQYKYLHRIVEAVKRALGEDNA